MRALALLLLVALAPAQDRPNVLWISSEDNGPDLGCYGSPVADTPNLDALAAEGMIYTRCWSNAPVCSTARTTIILGAYPQAFGAENHRSRVRLPTEIRPFPQLLRDAGYWCSNNSKTDYNLTDTGRIWDESSRNAHWRGRAEGQPFFSVFNLGVSHESQIRKTPHELVHDPAEVPIPPQHPDTPEVRAGWAQYHDKITEMDRQAGRLLEQLAKDGLTDDTIVFYWGDHGSGMPGFKRNPKNQGMHVPLIVRVPEKWREHAGSAAPGSRTDRLVAFVDLGPTVLSLAGVATPESMHGKAFLGPHAAAPKTVLLGYRGRMDERNDFVRTVTDGRYVYVRNFLPWLPLGQHVAYMFQTPTTQVWKRLFDEGALNDVQAAFWRPRPPEELYDLEDDPDETVNLVTSSDHAAALGRLRTALRDEILEHSDLGFVPEAMRERLAPDAPPSMLRIGSIDGPPTELWLDAAWRASSGNPDDEADLVRFATRTGAVARHWGLLGLMHRGADVFSRHREIFEKALDDNFPSNRVVAAEALVRFADDPTARARLVELADRRNEGFFVALAAWNAIDRLDEHMAPSRDALMAIPDDVRDLPGHVRNYLPRLREKTLADLEER